MTVLRWIDWFGRRCVAWPLVIVGMALSHVSGWCIRAGAFLADVDWSEMDV